MCNKAKEIFMDFPLREKIGKLKVGVLAGGISPEREVSLSTGKGIHNALLSTGYDSRYIDFHPDLIDDIKNIDIAFIALHGKYGEDGTVQGLLELLKIPYTGSGVLSSAIAMDKIFSKKIFELECIPTPPAVSLYSKDKIDLKDLDREIINEVKYPVIVKPNRGGSTIGVTIIEDSRDLPLAIELAFKYDSSLLIEKYIKGKLLTVSIIGSDPVALPVIEIRPKSGFYDYESKYTQGMTDYIVPAPIDKDISDAICKAALKCHKSLDCGGVSRVDIILADD